MWKLETVTGVRQSVSSMKATFLCTSTVIVVVVVIVAAPETLLEDMGSGCWGTARGPMRHRPFGNIDRRPQQHMVSRSPSRDPGEAPDEYEIDSFVVPNEAEIAYSLSSDI